MKLFEELTQDEEFKFLVSEGLSGSLNDMVVKYLISQDVDKSSINSMTSKWKAGVSLSTPLSYTVGGNADSIAASGNTSTTFSSLSIGSEPASGRKRYVVVVEGGASAFADSNISTTSLTIGGITATKALGNLSTSTSFKQYCGVWYAEVPTGTVASVSMVAGAARGFGVQLYSVYMDTDKSLALSDTSVASGTTTLTTTVDVPTTNALTVAAAQYRNGEDTPSISFGGSLGVTTDYRRDLSSNENFYSGSILTTGAATNLTTSISDPVAAGLESVALSCVFSSI